MQGKEMEKKKKSKIDFIYQKNNGYKNHHVDGAVGSLTPKGLVHLNFFIERNPIPQIISFELTENNTLGNEVGRSSKTGIIREIETGIIVDIPTAKAIVKWLNEKIDEHSKVFKSEKNS